MNIFVYDDDPWTSALWLDDVRKNKMISETCQLLSTAIYYNAPRLYGRVYRKTHDNHGCSIWARQSWGNYQWLLSYLRALYHQRGRPHKAFEKNYFFLCQAKRGDFFLKERTPFVNHARRLELGLDFTWMSDTQEAYRRFTKCRWETDKIRLSWEFGEKPSWAG